MVLPLHLANKAEKEATRLTAIWMQTHPEEMEVKLKAELEKGLEKARKPLWAIQDTFCRAHITGGGCVCKLAPGYKEACEQVEKAQKPLTELYARITAVRHRVYGEYHTTLLRGIIARINYMRV